MKKYILITKLIVLSVSVVAQNASIKKASKSYNNYDYSSVVDKVGDKKDISTDVIRKLAESYKMVGDYKNAEANYSKVALASDKTPDDIYAYAQILRINSKYTEAAQQMDAYAVLKATDSRVALYNGNKQYISELLKDNGQFTIKNLEINSVQQDFGPAYYKNDMVYTSSRGKVGPVARVWNGNKLHYLDLYTAKKESSNELSKPEKISSIDKKYHEGPACYSKDGNVMMFTSDNYKAKSTDGIRKLQLFETKMNKDGKWSERVPFPYNNNEYSCGHPALTADGNTLYFSSDMPGGKGGVDIYKTTRGADGKWTKPENLGDKINTEGNEMFPFIHESGLFFFSSDGRPGLGGLDVFATEIKVGNINKVINIGSPINSSKDDFTMVLDAEKKKGYFASNREGGKGDDDIYSYELLKPIVFGRTLKGIVKDVDGNIIPDAEVVIENEKTQFKYRTLTPEKTFLQCLVEDTGVYLITINKEKYTTVKKVVTVVDGTDPTVFEVILVKSPDLALRAFVTDSKTNSPLEGVKLKFTDNITGQVYIEELTPTTGEVFKPLTDKKVNDVLDYKIELVKAGYFPKAINFKYTIPQPGVVIVHEILAGALALDKEVKDIKDLVVINDIRFDLNKFNIRTDAASELDKVVEVMNRYPGMVVELGSHTDCRASKTYNMNLSDKRAKASAAYIKKKITNPERIYGKGYGESILLNGCACEGTVKSTCSEEEHEKNRRTEFRIISMGGGAKNVDVKNNSTNSFDKK